MTKVAPDALIDAELDYIAGCDRQITCSQAPASYAEATATYDLATATMTPVTDFTKADDTSGRKVTMAAKSGVTIDHSGMATHIALVKTGDTTLRGITELGTVRQNTAQAGGATTITLDTGASAVDQAYLNMAITIVSGTGAGQTRYITNYVGSTKVATVATWTVNPDATSIFRIYGQALTAAGTVDFPVWKWNIQDPT